MSALFKRDVSDSHYNSHALTTACETWYNEVCWGMWYVCVGAIVQVCLYAHYLYIIKHVAKKAYKVCNM